MKTKNKNREAVRNIILTVKINREEKEILEKAALEMGITMSSLVRFAIKNLIKKEGF